MKAHELKDLTVEEVQRIKDLVSKVGSLEFRILANEQDDAEGIKVAMNQINNPANQQKLRTGFNRVWHAAGFSVAGLRAGWGETAFRQEAEQLTSIEFGTARTLDRNPCGRSRNLNRHDHEI